VDGVNNSRISLSSTHNTLPVTTQSPIYCTVSQSVTNPVSTSNYRIPAYYSIHHTGHIVPAPTLYQDTWYGSPYTPQGRPLERGDLRSHNGEDETTSGNEQSAISSTVDDDSPNSIHRPAVKQSQSASIDGDNGTPTRNAGSAPRVKRRVRTTFSPTQLRILEQTYEMTQYPDINQRESVASECCISEARVQVWFQNRRARSRRLDALAAASQSLRHSSSSPNGISNLPSPSSLSRHPSPRSPLHSSPRPPLHSSPRHLSLHLTPAPFTTHYYSTPHPQYHPHPLPTVLHHSYPQSVIDTAVPYSSVSTAIDGDAPSPSSPTFKRSVDHPDSPSLPINPSI
ncbi:hypothetical protein PFISCL1PPCAC_15390, partial [Pristionchus fissidentatus]